MCTVKCCYINIFFVGFISVTSHQLHAQLANVKATEYQDTTKEFAFDSNISLYLEFLGKGFYSVNADYRKDTATAASMGLQWVENAFIPSVMYYHLSGESFRSEVGGGISSIFTRNDGLAALMIHGNFGYRYQKKDHIILRITFAPFIGIPLLTTGKFIILPWVGASIGYTF